MRRMALYWGITPFYFKEDEEGMDAIHHQMMDVLKEKKLVQNGDKIVITHGDGKYFKQGTSNSLRVEIIKDIPREDFEKKSLGKFQEVEIEKGRILLDTSVCASCQSCVQVCPHGIWQVQSDKDKNTRINEKRAHECSKDMECVESCPTGAIEILITDL
jgi:pyruvate kinase